MNEAMLAEIKALTAELRKQQEKNVQDFIRRDEIAKISADIVAKAHPVQADSRFKLPADTPEGIRERLEVFKNRTEAYHKAEPWTSEYGKKFGDIHGFIRAVNLRSPLLESSKTIMSEGTPAQGGYLVPVEFSNEVIRLEQNIAVGRSIARVMPMSSMTRTFPRQLTNISIAWVEEAAAKTPTKPTFNQLTQTAHVMAAIIMMSDELLRDSAINLQAFLADLIATAMFLEEDAQLFSGAGAPFTGVRNAAGVINVPMAAAALVYNDIIALEFGVAQAYQKNGIYAMNRAALLLIMQLQSTTGFNIWHQPQNGVPGLINNRSYVISDQIAAVAGAQPVLFGDFKKYAYISPRQGMAVKVSQDAYDATTGENAYMNDQTWLRFTKALSIDIALGAAFAYQDVA